MDIMCMLTFAEDTCVLIMPNKNGWIHHCEKRYSKRYTDL